MDIVAYRLFLELFPSACLHIDPQMVIRVCRESRLESQMTRNNFQTYPREVAEWLVPTGYVFVSLSDPNQG